VGQVAERHLRPVGQGFKAAYEGTSDEYDESRFYVRSVNKHDHRAETRVSMPPELYSQITHLIASGELGGTPITSYQAFMRDAAVHNLHRIARVKGSAILQELANRQRALARIEQAAEEAAGLAKIVQECDERLNAACKAGDAHHVATLIEMYEGIAAETREPYSLDIEDSLRDARRWLRARGT